LIRTNNIVSQDHQKMRIGINGISLNFKRKTTGIGRYTFSLIEEFNNYNNYKFFVFVDRLFKWKELKNLNFANIYPVFIPFPTFLVSFRKFWSLKLLALYLKLYKIDLFFAPDGILPIKGYKSSVVTIHDLAFLKFPQTLKKDASIFFKSNYQRAIQKADYIITGSEHSKNDILENYSLSDGKIHAIYHGVSEFFYEPINEILQKNFMNKFEISSPFIFYMGTLEPRKNLISVLNAFINVAGKYKDLLLVIGGVKGWLTKDFDEKLKQHSDLSDRIKLVGKLTDLEYKILLHNCEVFMYIPFYEGFGLPVLEAMAVGCRIITSDSSSLPEIVGDTCIKVSPTDLSALTEKLEQILLERKYLNKDAITRSKNFTWGISSAEHIRIFNLVLKNKLTQ